MYCYDFLGPFIILQEYHHIQRAMVIVTILYKRQALPRDNDQQILEKAVLVTEMWSLLKIWKCKSISCTGRIAM